MILRFILGWVCICVCLSSISAQEPSFELRKLSTYHTGIFDEGSAEIVSYDAETQRAFFTNSETNAVTVIDVSDPYYPSLITEINHDAYGAEVNSIAIQDGVVAVAVESNIVTDNGRVVFWTTDGNYINDVEVGPLPDMLIFTPNGRYVLVANEGEPNDDYSIDPEGSVSIIDISAGIESASVSTADFSSFDKETLLSRGIRIFGPNATAAQDLEPEYIAVSDASTLAYVACQENNALAVVNIASSTIIDVLPLGYKDHSIEGNGLDASNRDDSINISTYPVLGMYQPDAIKYINIEGSGYIVSANEGDARDYDGYSEEVRIKDLQLDATAFPNSADMQKNEVLGRLKTTTATGDIDNDGDFDEIYTYGGRSFSIWDSRTGSLVWDSGDEIEKILAEVNPRYFNATNDENNFDNRSDDKGPEPEAVEIAVIDDHVFAILGLERVGGLMVYDITDPTSPKYVNYINNRNFYADPEGRIIGDLGPESIYYVAPEDSPLEFGLLLSANEVSGTMTIFSVNDTIKDIIFDEEINVVDYASTEIILPPSPLESEVIFIGGYDLVETTPTYGNPAGKAVAKEWHDFIGFTRDESGESLGWVTVNHEQIYRDDRIGDGGGMTSFKIGKDANGNIEVLDQTLSDGRSGKFFNVDFANTVGETGMNCGGINAPDGRIWTAEEWYRNDQSSIWNSSARTSSLPLLVNDVNAGFGVRDTQNFTINTPEFPTVDGLEIQKFDNFNYMVEVDPKEALAIRKQYNWMRAGWEGGAITEDMKTVYLGIDGVPAPWVKFEADTPRDFTKGTLYVYKHDNAQGERWISVPETVENIFGGLTNYAWSVGATMFMRNEWVTIDNNTGLVYWTETGRDSGSSGPGRVFNAATQLTNAVVAPHHQALALNRGYNGATDTLYQDYYGRVLYYDPQSEEVGVAIEGGPFFDESPEEEDYPSIHLSNPDGLSVLELDGQNFLMISEDLNGSSNGRTPNGVSNRLCELYLLDTRKVPATTDDLVRVTAVPAGAEITGAIQIDENTVLFNSQHPRVTNPFPFNHSTTIALNGFADIELKSLDPHDELKSSQQGMIANAFSRMLYLDMTKDAALYDKNGDRLKVFRNTKSINLRNLKAGRYYVQTEDKQLYNLSIK